MRTRKAVDELTSEFSPDEIARAMELAGIEPDKVYAFRKTGLMPCYETQHLFSRAAMAEWDAAIAEYHAAQPAAAKGAGA
jgi:hypothetical protein